MVFKLRLLVINLFVTTFWVVIFTGWRITSQICTWIRLNTLFRYWIICYCIVRSHFRRYVVCTVFWCWLVVEKVKCLRNNRLAIFVASFSLVNTHELWRAVWKRGRKRKGREKVREREKWVTGNESEWVLTTIFYNNLYAKLSNAGFSTGFDQIS